MNWLCLKDANKGMAVVKQTLSDNIEKVLKMKLHMTGKENALEKDAFLNIWKKLAEVLKINKEIKMMSQEIDLGNIFLLDLQKKLVKPWKKSMWWDKEKLKRNQILKQDLIELKFVTLRSKRKKYKVKLLCLIKVKISFFFFCNVLAVLWTFT